MSLKILIALVYNILFIVYCFEDNADCSFRLDLVELCVNRFPAPSSVQTFQPNRSVCAVYHPDGQGTGALYDLSGSGDVALVTSHRVLPIHDRCLCHSTLLVVIFCMRFRRVLLL